MKLKYLIWLIVMVCLVSNVTAIGVMPAVKNIWFEPDERLDLNFIVVNNEDKILGAKLYVEGALENNIILKQSEIVTTGEEAAVGYSVFFPTRLDPGVYTSYIVIEEFDPLSSDKQFSIESKLIVKHKVNVYVPYPSKFMIADVNVRERSDQIDFVTKVKNMGDEFIGSTRSKIDVYDKDIKIKTLESGEISLVPKKQDELMASMDREEINRGEYRVLANVNYDGNLINIVRSLTIGEPKIILVNYTQYFTRDKLNEFQISIKSDWNQMLEDVSIEFFIFKDNKEIKYSKTPGFTLDPFGEKKISIYWDPSELEPGTYEAVLLIHRGDMTERKVFSIELVEAESSNLLFVILAAVIIIMGVIILVRLQKTEPKEIQELSKLIASQLRKGVDKQVLRDKLLKAGYTRTQIRKAVKLLKRGG